MAKLLLKDKYRPILIDELTIGKHYHLHSKDICFYLMEYKKDDDYRYNEEKQLIFNFKIKYEFKGSPRWRYKGIAISQIIDLFKSSVVPGLYIENTTLVPIPPSRHKGSPLYDNRMSQVLDGAYDGEADIRELIINIDDIRCAHDNPNNRPSLKEIQDNLTLDGSQSNSLGDTIILFDDVLTSGAHFQACKNIILATFPDKLVIGFFISRTFWEEPASVFDDFTDLPF